MPYLTQFAGSIEMVIVKSLVPCYPGLPAHIRSAVSVQTQPDLPSSTDIAGGPVWPIPWPISVWIGGCQSIWMSYVSNTSYHIQGLTSNTIHAFFFTVVTMTMVSIFHNSVILEITFWSILISIRIHALKKMTEVPVAFWISACQSDFVE